MREALTGRGLTIAAMAARLDVSVRTMHHYFNDEREPPYDRLVEFSEITGIHIGDLLRRPDEKPLVLPEIEGETLVQIPVLDAVLSGGNGAAEALGEIIGHIGFPQSWLSRHGVNGAAAKIVQIRGDSMAPTLPDSSHVMVDTRDTELPNKRELMAFEAGGDNLVKRLEIKRSIDGNKERRYVLIISDNPDYPTEMYDLARNPINIIGRVVWAGQWVSRHL